MKLVTEFKNIKKIFLIFVVFFILILLFLALSKKNEETKYEAAYFWDNKIIYQTWELDNFENIEVNSSKNINKQKEKYDLIIKQLREKIKEKEANLTSATNINYSYSPLDLEDYLVKSNKLSDISDIIFSHIFLNKNLKFDVDFYKSKSNIRWRYTNNVIKIFDTENLPKEELLSVFIHELWHYFDVKYLEKQVLFDLSDKFYNISWSDTKTIKNWSDKKDFVSWYAMTNKFEDFAESFNYYILFNDDFREKTAKSEKLQKKYDFFSKYIFRNDEFKKTNFRTFEKNLDYYWDTTKIKFSTTNFLKYLGN